MSRSDGPSMVRRLLVYVVVTLLSMAVLAAVAWATIRFSDFIDFGSDEVVSMVPFSPDVLISDLPLTG